MVKKILFLITKEVSGLHQAAYVLAAFTLLSQLLGLFRDRLLAHLFGASATLDVYYAAFRIPDLLLATAASIVSISILVPMLTEKLEKGRHKGKAFIDSIFTAFFYFIIAISALAYFVMPHILPVVFPGITGNDFTHLLALSRLLLLSPILLGFSNLFASIIQVHKKFFIYALSPILYNLGIIFGIIVLYPRFGLLGLGMGVILGACLHLLIQLPAASSVDFMPRLRSTLRFDDMRRVVLTSIPRAFTLSTTHITLLVFIGLASLMAEGAITIFNFSYNLQSVPLALIGVSYSLAAFPTLSRLFAESNVKEFVMHVITATRHIIFWSVPATLLFIVLRAHIVRVLLGTGAFGWDATRLTAAALALFVLSILAQGLVLLYIRGYYASGNTRRPLYINLVGALSSVVSAFVFTALFKTSEYFRYFMEALLRVEGVAGTQVLMLPLGFSLGMIFNALLFWLFFQRDFNAHNNEIKRTLGQVLAASIIAGFASYKTLELFADPINTTRVIGLLLQGILAGIAGALVYGGILYLLKNTEIIEMTKALREKLWRVDVSPPEASEL